MKKKLVLGLQFSVQHSMLCGFDNTQTANDVLSRKHRKHQKMLPA